MKISRNSWHYQMLQSWSFEIPHNLCPYFWKVVWCLLLYPILGVGAMLIAFLATMPFWWRFMEVNQPSVSLVVFIGAWEIIGLLFALKSSIQSRHRQEVYEGVREVPRDGLLKMWFKARYEKVCPYLEFD